MCHDWCYVSGNSLLSLGYFKDTICYLGSKASFYQNKQYCFIYTVFDCLIVGELHFFGQFRGYLEVLALNKIHAVRTIFQKKSMFYNQDFFLLQMCPLLDFF